MGLRGSSAPEMAAENTHISIAAEADAAAWDAYVSGHPGATAYHRWAWRDVFGGVFGHEPVYLVARRGGEAVGVLPLVAFRSRLFGRFLCSLPFVNYGGTLIGGKSTVHSPQSTGHEPPAAVLGPQSTGHELPADRGPRTEDREPIAAALMERAAELARDRGAAHVELRHIAPLVPGVPTRKHKVTMWLTLAADGEGQWKALDNKVRNQVRKAEKSGLTATTGGAELLDAFYPVFAETMRDLGTPVYPRRFFDAVLRASGSAARVHAVWQEGRPLGASVTVDHAGRTEVPWAAALRAYRHLCPNMLLYWHMLQDTVARGVPVFDFGRSTPGEGTYHFKKQWKAQAVPLHWEYALTGRDALPDQSPTNAKFHLAIEVWKRLPLAVANRLGPLVIGNIP
jgi:FemAB-related protein (PEP-CTERM system-associated)